MILTLQLVPARGSRLDAGVARRQTFGREGGTLGRDPESTWVLPDSNVSRCHARISWREGRFCVEDDSVNGTFLNSRRDRLPRGEPQPLEPGDHLIIGPYTIAVSIAAPAPAGRSRPRSDDPYGLPAPVDRLPALNADDDSTDRVRSPAPAIRDHLRLDPLIALNLESPAPPPRTPRAEDLEAGDPFDFAYRPPAAVAEASPVEAAPAFPRGYNPLVDDSQAVPRPIAPSLARPAPVAPPPVVAADLAAVLQGAGLDPALATPELGRELGELLRVVVAELRDLLHARVDAKDEFGLRQTRFQPAENNPLKFSPTVEAALHALLVARDPVYLDPVSAVRQAFADIKQHQFALLVGLRQGFESMLTEFDPDHLQQEFDRELGKGLMPAKLRYWDQYCERLRALARDSDARFRQLFGDQFAQAYAEQLAKSRQLHERASPEATAPQSTGAGPLAAADDPLA